MITRRQLLMAGGGVVGGVTVLGGALAIGHATAGPGMGRVAASSVVLPAGRRAVAYDPVRRAVWVLTRCEPASPSDPVRVVLHRIDSATGQAGDEWTISTTGQSWNGGAVVPVGDELWLGFGDQVYRADVANHTLERLKVPWKPTGPTRGRLASMAYDGEGLVSFAVAGATILVNVSPTTGRWGSSWLGGESVAPTSSLAAWPHGVALAATPVGWARRLPIRPAGSPMVTLIDIHGAVISEPVNDTVVLVSARDGVSRWQRGYEREVSLPWGGPLPRSANLSTDGSYLYWVSTELLASTYSVSRMDLSTGEEVTAEFPSVTRVVTTMARPRTGPPTPTTLPLPHNPLVDATVCDGSSLWIFTRQGRPQLGAAPSSSPYASVYRMPLRGSR